MTRFMSRFTRDASGAVTIDWVVLTAAVVGIAVAASVSIADGTARMGSDVETFLQTDERFIQNR